MKKPHYPIHRHEQKQLLGFIDGLEGGFAIFAGIVVGLSFATTNRSVLILTALIGIMVNAVNAVNATTVERRSIDTPYQPRQRRGRPDLLWPFVCILQYIVC
mgnify:CR=1 FL=1